MIKAYAKINLQLEVIKKLDNGFHELKMINSKISLFDKIYIKESKNNKIKYSNFKIPKEEDTILKVIEMLQLKYPSIPNQSIYIKKYIPIGGGMGGMSSDVSEILKYLNTRYDLHLTIDEMCKILMPIGKDMCYALYDEPCIVEGMGEIIKKYDKKLPDKIIVLNPLFKCNTKDIYNYYDQIDWTNINKDIFRNHLEYAFRKLYPKMNQLFNELIDLNIGNIQLTGSGSCILIFNEDKKVLKMLKKKYKQYKVNIYKIRKGK